MTIELLQKTIDEWSKRYGVSNYNELTNMAILSEEVGEVARIMARRYGEQSAKPNEELNLADELADVIFVVICIANQTGIDLTQALQQNLEKKTSRDKERHINNEKLR